MLYRYIIQPCSRLKPGGLVNNIQYRIAINVNYVNEYRLVKINVFFESEFETAW